MDLLNLYKYLYHCNFMSIDELTERTEINFPRNLDERELKKLVAYLGEMLIANVDFIISENYRASRIISLSDKRTQIRLSSMEASGTIIGYNRSANFRCKTIISDKYSRNLITGMKFDTIPGYNIREHRQEEVKLWAEIKNYIESYKP